MEIQENNSGKSWTSLLSASICITLYMTFFTGVSSEKYYYEKTSLTYWKWALVLMLHCVRTDVL